MLSDLLTGELCKWCSRDLSRSFLSLTTGAVEKDDAVVYPVWCACGGVTIVRGSLLRSRLDRPKAATVRALPTKG